MIQAIKNYAIESVKNAVIPDGIDGYVFADWLLLMNGHIVVLNFEPRRGYIFGAANIDEWTCVENNRTEKFINPLKRTALFAQQSCHIAGFENIRGHVLFASACEFPKGMPDGVLQMTRFERTLESLSAEDDDHESLYLAWSKLKRVSKESTDQINALL